MMRLGREDRLWTALVLMAALLLPLGGGHAESLRVGSWNIQDLHHQEGGSLRLFGDYPSFARRVEDYALLAKYRDSMGRDQRPADIMALQEIGTKAALERLFSDAEYETHISPRWRSDGAPEFYGLVSVLFRSVPSLMRHNSSFC